VKTDNFAILGVEKRPDGMHRRPKYDVIFKRARITSGGLEIMKKFSPDQLLTVLVLGLLILGVILYRRLSFF
jgi:hypothetical protein